MDLTHAEREAAQDHVARRHLQIRYPLVGRRGYDKPARDFRGNLERYIRWQLEQEPWRRRRLPAR